MFTRCIWLFTLAISSRLLARASFVETAKSNFVQEFTKSCPTDGIPVCGIQGKGDYFLLPNKCWLDALKAEGLLGKKTENMPLKHCIRDCNLKCSTNYEGVCVVNVRTNERMMFANMCQVTEFACKTTADFQQLHPTACAQLKPTPPLAHSPKSAVTLPHTEKVLEKRSQKYKNIPIPCTEKFKPVCGLYKGVKSTFKNECFLNAENVKYGKDWRVVKRGMCDEDNTNVRRNAQNKPNKAHSMMKRSYGSISNYMNFQSIAPVKTDFHTSNNGLHKYLPQIFQSDTDYIQRKISNAALKDQITNNIIQKIISYPAPTLDAISQERTVPAGMQRNNDRAAIHAKPMQYRGNIIPDDYNSVGVNNLYTHANPVVAGRQILPPVPAMADKPAMYSFDNIHAQKSHIDPLKTETFVNSPNAGASANNNNNFYYQAYDISYPITTPQPLNDVGVITRTTITTATTTTRPMTTAVTEAPLSADHFFIISQRATPKYMAPEVAVNTPKPYKGCKFGNIPICGGLPNGTLRTFDNICTMMTTNSFLKITWVKLHYGNCEVCENNCSRNYKPVCVQRNGSNYTMANECYYNMAICLDKKSKWKIVSDGECQQYTRIEDKYPNAKVTTTPASTTSAKSSTRQNEEILPERTGLPRPGRNLKKRVSSSSRKVPRRSRPSTATRSKPSYVMDLTKRKKRRNPSSPQ